MRRSAFVVVAPVALMVSIAVAACGGGEATSESTSGSATEPSTEPATESTLASSDTATPNDTVASSDTGAPAVLEPDLENPDALPPMRDSVHLIDTPGSDVILGVAARNDGRVWLSGHTDNTFLPNLGGGSAGQLDALLVLYDAEAETSYPTFSQFGTPEADAFLGVATTPDGGAVAVGYSKGEFASANYGINDMIAVSVDADGRERWRVQLGGPDWDRGYSVVANPDGSVFLGGYTFGGMAENFDSTGAGGHDAVVAKVSADGVIEWVRSIGTDDVDWGQSMASDGEGGVVMVGYTQGSWSVDNAGARDLFVTRVSADGETVWTLQTGTEVDDWLQGVTVLDDGSIIGVGFTAGALGYASGGTDILLVHVSSDGELLGIKQLGTAGDDRAFGVLQHESGELIISGTVSGAWDVDSEWSEGKKDVFVAGLDETLDLRWVSQFGSYDGADDDGYGIAMAGSVLWFVGVTAGDIGGSPVSGATDGWVTSYRCSGEVTSCGFVSLGE